MYRHMVSVMLYAFSALAPLAQATEQDSGYLAETPFLNFEDPSLKPLTERFRADHDDPRERAVAIHDFVRDTVNFGWTRRFYNMRASEVLEAGVGYCNTKSTLFVALLRGASIPARQRFVTIPSAILSPFITLPQQWVDHSYTEVWLAGRWIATDSYIVDSTLFNAARLQLQLEGKTYGYGIHMDGTTEWDGYGSAFSQYVPRLREGSVRYERYADIGAFYAAAPRGEKLSGLQRFLIPLGLTFAQNDVAQFRAAGTLATSAR